MASKGTRLLHENSAGPRRLIIDRSCLATETEQREAKTDSEGDNDDLGATALFCHGFPFEKQVSAFYHLRLFSSEEFRERTPAKLGLLRQAAKAAYARRGLSVRARCLSDGRSCE